MLLKINPSINIDAIRINFDTESLWVLNIAIGIIMFGVALGITSEDFKRLIRHPKILLVGVFSQFILLPALTFLAIIIIQPHPSFALGMMMIAACPGGNISNFFSKMAKGNAALSILMTSISTLMAIFMTPLLFSIFARYVPGTESLNQSIYVDPIAMVTTILKLVVVPLVIGMVLNHYKPVFTKKIQFPTKVLSIIIFFGIVVFAVIGNFENILNYLDDIFFIVLIHNALAFLLGYYWARFMKMSSKNVRAISIETGIQNSGLALIIVFNFFEGLGGMALVTAWWGIWHLISGFSVAMWWSNQKKEPSNYT